MFEEERTDAFALPVVADDKGNFRPVGLFIKVVSSNCNNVFAVGLGYGPDNGHVLAVIDVDEVLDLSVGETHLTAHEPVIDGLTGQGIDQVAHAGFVRRLDGADGQLCAIFQEQRGAHGLVGRQDELVADPGHIRANIVGLDGIPEQLFPKIRMGDGNQGHDPILDTLAVEISHPVLRDYVGHSASGDGNPGAQAEPGHDIGTCSFPVGRGDGDDALAVLDAGIEHPGVGVGADLAGEVDLLAHVDRHHLGLLADDAGIVDIFSWSETEKRVVVDHIVEFFGSHTETGDDPAAIAGFARTIDDA